MLTRPEANSLAYKAQETVDRAYAGGRRKPRASGRNRIGWQLQRLPSQVDASLHVAHTGQRRVQIPHWSPATRNLDGRRMGYTPGVQPKEFGCPSQKTGPRASYVWRRGSRGFRLQFRLTSSGRRLMQWNESVPFRIDAQRIIPLFFHPEFFIEPAFELFRFLIQPTCRVRFSQPPQHFGKM